MRCHQCAAELKPGLTVCPDCGATIGRSRRRGTVRCRSCQNRVPAGLAVCPQCGAALRPSWQVPLLVVVVLLSLAGAAYGLTHYVPWDDLRVAVARARLPALSFLSTPTPTPTRTPTRLPTRTVTPTRTATRVVPTPTATPTLPTATWTRAAPTRTPPPKATPSPAFRLAQPLLISPANGQQIKGGSNQIRLTWQPAMGLAEDEWYALSVRFLADGATLFNGSWTKDTTWLVPRELYNQAGQRERDFQWDVTIKRQTGTKADGGREGVPVSPTSETWTFSWI